jgi:hypothetical protein
MGCLKLTYQPIKTLHIVKGERSREEKCAQLWLSVDPLAEKYPSISSFAYVAQNPIIYIDPDGKQIEYHKNNTFWFNFGAKLRIFSQSIFGTKETRSMIKQLNESENVHTITQKDGTYLGSISQASSLYDYDEEDLNNPIPMPDFDSATEVSNYDKKRKIWEDNKPKDHRNGEGDGSYISIDFKTDKINREDNSSIEGSYKSNKALTLFHELFHSFRIDKGVIKDNKTEEVKATQFINRNFRNDKNRRKKYYKWDVPK